MATRIEPGQNQGRIPTRIVMRVKDLPAGDAFSAAKSAVVIAQQLAPKTTGESAASFKPIWGEGYFGITWSGAHVWYQEMGIRPFTMNNLAGKTIPMWIEDPMGVERARNPRARTRITKDGRMQVLIFRRAARRGETKTVVRRDGTTHEVPRSYPGAPGRISRREAPAPHTSEGKVAGQIAKGNIGVRWRHPGTFGRYFLREALERTAVLHGLPRGPVEAAVAGERFRRQRMRAA